MKYDQELTMLRAQVELGVLPARNVNDFDLARHSKLVPPFNESDPNSYFRLFEKTAAHLNWTRIQWTWLLQTKLCGKAATVYNHLEENHDYDRVKETILAAYSITVEGYRQKFS